METNLPPFNERNYFYRFLPFDKPSNQAEGWSRLDIFSKSSLYINHVDELNDPFEFFFKTKKLKTKERGKKIENLKTYLLKNHGRSLSKTDEGAMIENALRSHDSLFHEWHKKNSLRLLREKLGVCCFSQTVKSVPNWAHYADKHQGFCLMFNNACSFSKYLLPVNYSVKLPVYEFFSPEENAMLKRIMTRKHPDWKYEKEVRVLSHPVKGFERIEKSDLFGVIFGHKSSAENIDRLQNIAKINGFSVNYFQSFPGTRGEIHFRRYLPKSI